MKVLVYLDPAPRGEWALAAALLLAPEGFSHVRLLATREDVTNDPGLLARARARFAGGPPLSEAIRPGPAERAVVAEAGAQPWDLVVVPPAGRGALARMLMGSRVATVVRAVRAPVLVARRPPERLERLLGALSGRRSTAGVIATSLAWRRRTGAHARFVHVEAAVALPRHGAERGGERDDVLSALGRHGLERELIAREGLVVEEVLDVFEEGAFQLLVVGAREEDEEAAFGREDVTERLLLRCPASTLIVPPGTGQA